MKRASQTFQTLKHFQKAKSNWQNRSEGSIVTFFTSHTLRPLTTYTSCDYQHSQANKETHFNNTSRIWCWGLIFPFYKIIFANNHQPPTTHTTTDQTRPSKLYCRSIFSLFPECHCQKQPGSNYSPLITRKPWWHHRPLSFLGRFMGSRSSVTFMWSVYHTAMRHNWASVSWATNKSVRIGWIIWQGGRV